jgi:hypothetical protein
MSRRLLLSSLLAAGCAGKTYEVAHTGGNVRITDGVRGGELYASYTVDGIGFSAAVTGDNFERAVFDGEQQRFGGGVDVGLRASLLGLFAKDHRIDHWVDVGGAIGGGGGLIYPARLTTYGEGWVGGWMTIGLAPGKSYPSLVVDVRRQAVTDWNNETLFSVGLAFTSRFTTEHTPGFGFR